MKLEAGALIFKFLMARNHGCLREMKVGDKMNIPETG